MQHSDSSLGPETKVESRVAWGHISRADDGLQKEGTRAGTMIFIYVATPRLELA